MEKQYEVRITPFAENSMQEISSYISVDLMAPASALSLMQELQKKILSLSSLPNRVHLTPEEPWHSLGIRRMLVRNFYIYFLVKEEEHTVQVTDVTYAHREQNARLTRSLPDDMI